LLNAKSIKVKDEDTDLWIAHSLFVYMVYGNTGKFQYGLVE